ERLVEGAAAERVEHGLMPAGERLEALGPRDRLIADERIGGDRQGLSLDHPGVDLEPGELGRLVARRLIGRNVDAEELGRALEARGDIHIVSDGGIVEAPSRAEIAHATNTRV